MDPRDRREGGELLRELRVELHRARSERIESRVDSEVHLGEPREVPHNIEFGAVRDRESLASEFRGDEVRDVDRHVRSRALLPKERLRTVRPPHRYCNAS